MKRWAPLLICALSCSRAAPPRAPGFAFKQTGPGCYVCASGPDGAHAVVLIDVENRGQVTCLANPGPGRKAAWEDMCSRPSFGATLDW